MDVKSHKIIENIQKKKILNFFSTYQCYKHVGTHKHMQKYLNQKNSKKKIFLHRKIQKNTQEYEKKFTQKFYPQKNALSQLSWNFLFTNFFGLKKKSNNIYEPSKPRTNRFLGVEHMQRGAKVISRSPTHFFLEKRQIFRYTRHQNSDT